MLGRLHDQWRYLDREWRLELEREMVGRREWPRELEMGEELETLENTAALQAEPNPLQSVAKNNSNNSNYYQQARARPQHNAQPHQQPGQEPHNPINREHKRGSPWQPLMVAPPRPVFYQPQANPWPNQPPEPRGRGHRRS